MAVRRLGERQVHRRVFTGERRTGGDRCGQRRSVYLHNRSAARDGVARLNGSYDRFQLEGDLLARLQRWNDPFPSVSIPAGAFLGVTVPSFRLADGRLTVTSTTFATALPPLDTVTI